MKDFKQIFNDSYSRINTDMSFFFDVFYQKFAARSEVIAKAFENVDMERQRSMLESSFILLTTFSATGKADDYLVKLTTMHRAIQNITSDMYDQWLAALLETAAEMDPYFDDDVDLAWRIVMAPGITFMKTYRSPSNI